MVLAAHNLDYVVALVRVQVLDLLSICDGLFVAEAELTVVIHAPGINLVRIVDVEGMVPAAEDILCILCTGLLYF